MKRSLALMLCWLVPAGSLPSAAFAQKAVSIEAARVEAGVRAVLPQAGASPAAIAAVAVAPVSLTGSLFAVRSPVLLRAPADGPSARPSVWSLALPAPAATVPSPRDAPQKGQAGARHHPVAGIWESAPPSVLGQGRGGGATAGRDLLPVIDFKPFAPESLGRQPAAGAYEAGHGLMDKVLRIEPGVRSGDVPGVGAAGERSTRGARSRKGSGLKPAAKGSKARSRTAPVPAPVAEGEARAAAPADEAPAPRRRAGYEREEGVYSAHRLGVFERDPEEYVLNYLLGVEDPSPKGYELLTGLAVHRAKEVVYGWIKSGRPGRDINLAESLAEYDKAWKEGLAERAWKASDGWKSADYYNRGRMFVERRFAELYPFDKQGRILFLEEEMRWTLTDPVTGKAYSFRGTPDRVMIQGDTIYIRDWKTHFNPPSLQQLMRDDYQLALYVLALRQNRPDLVRGKKFKLAWDYREFTQEIEVDEAYLARAQERALSLIHGIETLTQRFEAERAEWDKRLDPDQRPAGLGEAKSAVDSLGKLASQIRDKRSELRDLRERSRDVETGLARFARAKGRTLVEGKTHRVTVETRETRVVPTKTDAPELHEAVVRNLQEAGVWEKYSSLHPASLKALAEVQGHPDHAAFERIRDLVRVAHANELELEENAEAAAPKRRGGGIAPSRIPKEGAQALETEPGVYSPHRLLVFAKDPKSYALQYLFGVKDKGPRGMDLLVGLAVHETMEEVFTLLKGGRPARDIRLADVLELYRRKFGELGAQAAYQPEKGLKPADYKRRGEAYIRKQWKDLYPFVNQGRIVYLERRMHFTLAEPRTGRAYRFQGIPDRVMIQGDTVYIRDWKTHWMPLTGKEVEDYGMQLGIYVMALRQLYPGLMAGRKAALVLDTRGGPIEIPADAAFMAKVETRVFKLIDGIERLQAEVERDRAKWEKIVGPVGAPKSLAEAGKWVDDLARLAERTGQLEGELKALNARSAELEAKVVEFARRSGRARVVGKDHTAALRKRGSVSVPTKTADREGYERVAAALKQAGVWERYSQMDYAALKKAMADPDHPDREVFRRIEPLVQTERATKLKLEPR